MKREAKTIKFGGIIMASAAQIQANRVNAQKSTGPRTGEGKERSSQNALKHGLLARDAVIIGEDPTEFEMYREGMIQTLAPVGPVETMLAERVVGLSWRLRRAEKLQNAAFAALDEGEPAELLEARLQEWKQHRGNEQDRGTYGALDENAALAKAVVEDFAEARVLDRMLMYERRIESSLYRAMAELRKEREARTAASKLQEASPSEGSLPAELASFGETAQREEEPTVKCQVSSDGSDFTFQPSHLTLLEEKITPCGVTTNEEGSATRGCSRDAAANFANPSPGGSDKRSPRSLSMASSNGQDHRQTSLSLPPGVEERQFSTPQAATPMSCETNPIAEEAPSLKCQVSSDGSDSTLQTRTA